MELERASETGAHHAALHAAPRVHGAACLGVLGGCGRYATTCSSGQDRRRVGGEEQQEAVGTHKAVSLKQTVVDEAAGGGWM